MPQSPFLYLLPGKVPTAVLIAMLTTDVGVAVFSETRKYSVCTAKQVISIPAQSSERCERNQRNHREMREMRETTREMCEK